MKIHQLSLFLENQPGQMLEPCRLPACAGIDIRTLSLADTRQFGILRVIVSDWNNAAALLQNAGYVVNVTEVVAVEVADRPGGLADLMALFENRSPIHHTFPPPAETRSSMSGAFSPSGTKKETRAVALSASSAIGW